MGPSCRTKKMRTSALFDRSVICGTILTRSILQWEIRYLRILLKGTMESVPRVQSSPRKLPDWEEQGTASPFVWGGCRCIQPRIRTFRARFSERSTVASLDSGLIYQCMGCQTYDSIFASGSSVVLLARGHRGDPEMLLPFLRLQHHESWKNHVAILELNLGRS